MNKNMTYKIDITKEPKLKKELENIEFEFTTIEHSFWRATKYGNTLTFYKNGNLLIQGKETSQIVNYLIDRGFIVLRGELNLVKWIGTDESGKGDYFGPLVIAGIMAEDRVKNEFLKIGVQDSKKLSDSTIAELAEKIKKLFPYSIVIINPIKYNELLNKMRNLNRLLAWGHARVIENLLEKESCEYAISDQFGDERYITGALMKKGKKINLEQRHHAEEDIAVAGASILARDEFIKKLEELSTNYGIILPKGASVEVIKIGKEFVTKFGMDKLKEVAKIHFKTTQKILKD